MKRASKSPAETAGLHDEPGMAERFQRGLRNLINTPPQPRKPADAKPKRRLASKGGVHKGKTGR